jgi:hypothetical protein
MHLSLTQWGLLVAGVVGPSAVLAVMHKRNLRREFPLFFNYMALYSLSACLTFISVFYTCSAYFYVYWGLSFLVMLTEFVLLHEILVNTLKPYSALIDLAKMLFLWAGLFLLLAASCMALATTGPNANKLAAAVGILERGIRLMQCGLLLFLFLFESRLGISWRNHGMSLAIGLGIYSASDLIFSYLRMADPRMWVTFQNIDGFIYLAVLGFWAVLLSLPEPGRKTVLDSPSRLIFQRWNEALVSATAMPSGGELALSPMDSFIPGVEKAVERVLARKMSH